MHPEKNLIKVEGNIIETLPIHCEKNIRREKEPFREVRKTVNGTIEIDHHSRQWTGFDWDVLMAVFALSKINGDARKFPATKKDISDILGLKYNPGTGQSIKESMKEWGAAIYYSGSFYDVNKKKYTTTGSGTTHTLSHYFVDDKEMKEEKISGRDIRQGSWIAIGEVFWESLKNNYFKLINWDAYKLLPRGWVRKTYLFIEKRLGSKTDYKENLESLIRSVTGKETLTATDVKNFKRRTLKELSHLYDYKYTNGLLTITRAEHIACRIRQAQLFPRLKQKPLNDWDNEILEKVSKFCGRDDKYFRNTVSKYIRRLGPERVYAAMKDTETSQANDRDKYLIHLLKITL